MFIARGDDTVAALVRHRDANGGRPTQLHNARNWQNMWVANCLKGWGEIKAPHSAIDTFIMIHGDFAVFPLR